MSWILHLSLQHPIVKNTQRSFRTTQRHLSILQEIRKAQSWNHEGTFFDHRPLCFSRPDAFGSSVEKGVAWYAML